MLSLLVSSMLAAVSMQSAPERPAIIVEGKKLQDAEANLRACLARNCPTDEDIDATLALAETQLMAGKYHKARTTLLQSLKRNKDAADRYPIPVSDLYRANGKVAANLGLDRDYYRSTWGIFRTLKVGLPSDHARKYTALMEVAEMTYRTRGHTRARLYYDKIAAEARRDGRPDLAAIAELRSAIRHLPPNSSMQLAEINRIANLNAAEMHTPVLEANLALARFAFQRGDEGGAQQVLKKLSSLNIQRPILIYSPPYSTVARALDTSSDFGVSMAPPPPTGGEPASGNQSNGGPSITKVFPSALFSTTNRLAGNFEDMWIDVAFQIDPLGRVVDPKIVKSKGELYWTKPLMTSLRNRRYTAGKLGDPASTRLERYTYTSKWERATATRNATRAPEPRIEYFDLSDVGTAL